DALGEAPGRDAGDIGRPQPALRRLLAGPALRAATATARRARRGRAGFRPRSASAPRAATRPRSSPRRISRAAPGDPEGAPGSARGADTRRLRRGGARARPREPARGD